MFPMLNNCGDRIEKEQSKMSKILKIRNMV